MTHDLWAARAFIQSYLDSYAILYGCQVHSPGKLNLLRYGSNVRAKLEDYEIYSLSQDPQEVIKTITELNLPPAERFILNIFHMEEEARRIEKDFESAGYRFAFTNVVRGLTLPTSVPDRGIPIKQVTDPPNCLCKPHAPILSTDA